MAAHGTHRGGAHRWRRRRTSGPPTSALGRWAFGLLLAFALFATIFLLAVGLGAPVGGGWTFYVTAGGSAATALAAALAGVLAVWLSRERSPIVYFAIAAGLFVSLFIAVELLFPA